MKNEVKNSIDQLFQEKLVDFELNPSSKAKKLFEERLAKREHKNKIKPLWGIYTAAAALMVVALGAWYFLSNIEPENQATIAQKTPTTIQQEVQNMPSFVVEQNKIRESKILATKTIVVAEKSAQKIEDNVVIESVLASKTEQVMQKEERLDDSLEEMTQKPVLQASLPKYQNTPVQHSLLPNDDGELVVTISSAATPTLALDDDNHVSVDEGKNMGRKKLEDAVKRPLVARVFEQLGNLKRGEKVDWEQMGLKKIPDNVNTFGRQTEEPQQTPLRKPYQSKSN